MFTISVKTLLSLRMLVRLLSLNQKPSRTLISMWPMLRLGHDFSLCSQVDEHALTLMYFLTQMMKLKQIKGIC